MYIQASRRLAGEVRRAALPPPPAHPTHCAHHTLYYCVIFVNHVPVFYRVQCFCDLCILLVPLGVPFRAKTKVVASEYNKVTVSLCCETCEHSSSFLALTHDIT